MNNPRLGDVKTGLVIIIRKIMLRSKQNSMTDNTKEEPARWGETGPSDFTNWPADGSTDLNQQSGGDSSEKSSEKNKKGEPPPDSGVSNN